MGCELTEAVQIGYGPFEGYGFHALKGCSAWSSGAGGETGVTAVSACTGEAMWEAMDRGVLSKELLEAAMKLVPAHAKGDFRELTRRRRTPACSLIEYRDGFKARGRDAQRLGPRGRRRGVHLRRRRSRARTSRSRASSTCSSPTRSPTSPNW